MTVWMKKLPAHWKEIFDNIAKDDYGDEGNEDSQAMDIAYFDTWVTFQITRDGTNSKLYADNVPTSPSVDIDSPASQG